MQKSVICVTLLLLVQVSICSAAGTDHKALYYPGDYNGKTLVFAKAKIGGAILKNSRTGLYGLNVEIAGKYTPGFLYKNQLNFVVVSSDLAHKLTNQLTRNSKYLKPRHEQNLMDHLNSELARPVRLTAKIEKLFGYWVAAVSKVEFYNNDGAITDTVR